MLTRASYIAPSSFDYIFSRLLIVRMTDWEPYIREVASLLKPDGLFEVQDTTYNVFKHNEFGDSEDCSASWKWSSLAVSEARRQDLEPLCGEYAEVSTPFFFSPYTTHLIKSRA